MPWLCRKWGRHITESPPSFQYENFLFGHHKTFPPSLLSRNACHHVLYYRFLVHLALLNSTVRQILVPFRTFWCSIFVFVLFVLAFRAIEWCEGSDINPRFAVPSHTHDSYRVSGRNWGRSTPNGTFQAVFSVDVVVLIGERQVFLTTVSGF